MNTAVDLPWGAWYGDTSHRLEFPDHWLVDVLEPRGAAACSSDDIAKALDAPIDSQPLCELAKGCRSVCVVVDDLARPTRAADVLPTLLAQIHEGGVPPEGVRIVVAAGSHGRLDEERMAWKVGSDVAAKYQVECHDCGAPLAATGIVYGDRELAVNRTFYESDLKIAIGSVMPHSFAGYSGGAKLVLPGLADLSATARSHKFVQLGLRGGTDPNENRFRREAEELARRLGLKFVVCVLANSNRETAAVFAGDVVAAHRRACAAAEELFRTELEAEYDCVLLGAYPKDVDLIQAENVFVSFKKVRAPVVRDGGVIVLATAASEGVGQHGLFQPGGVSYRRPQRKRALGERELWLYVPSLTTEEVRKLYWEGYPVFHDKQELTRALADRFAGPARAAVFPCAPMQQVVDMRQS